VPPLFIAALFSFLFYSSLGISVEETTLTYTREIRAKEAGNEEKNNIKKKQHSSKQVLALSAANNSSIPAPEPPTLLPTTAAVLDAALVRNESV
jgi:hypothetical protein